MKKTMIPGTLQCAAVDEFGNRLPVAEADDIYDGVHSKKQSQINTETYQYMDEVNTVIGELDTHAQEIVDLFNIAGDKQYEPLYYSGMARVNLPRQIRFIGYHFKEFVDGVSVEETIYVSKPDYIVYDTAQNLFLGAVQSMMTIKYYSNWDATDATYYTNPSESYRYVTNYGRECYRWNGSSLSETTDCETSNVLTQDVINTTNTIYIIQYDYTLDGESITIPDNCVLQFEGGSISQGSVILSSSMLKGSIKWENVVIHGSCANEVLTPQMFGAIGEAAEHSDAASVERDTLGFENLARIIDNAGTRSNVIYIPSGHYSIMHKIVIMSGCKIYGNGESSVIDCYNGSGGIYIGYSSSYLEKCEVLDCTLTEDANKGDISITVDNTSDININDYLILYDTVDGSFSKSRTYYRMSELVQVRAIEGNILHLYRGLYGTYPIEFGDGDVSTITGAPNYRITITKFLPQQYIILDVTIVSHAHANSSPATYYTLAVVGHHDSIFRNIHVENRGNSVAALIGFGTKYEVTKSTFKSYTNYVNDSYGLLITHSQDYIVSHCNLHAIKHTLATGGSGTYYGINNRNFVYDSLYLERDSDGLVLLDVHANAQYYTISNIVAPYAKCDTGGIDVTVENCVFYYISAAFNQSGFIIRNCEIMAAYEFLVPARKLNVPPEERDIVVENCLIHGYTTFNLQNASGLGTPMNKFVFKNNVCNGLRVRAGIIRTAIIEGNVFATRELNIGVDSENLQVLNNLFENGWLNIQETNEVYGLISGNKIHYNGEDNEKQLVYLNHFHGSFNNNHVTCSVPIKNALMLSYGKTRVTVYDNIFRVGDKPGNYKIIQAGSGTVLTANRNIHNSTRPSILEISESASGASTDKYNYVPQSQKFSDTNNIDGIGNIIYARNQNRLGYFSNGIGGDMLLQLSAVNETPSVENNIFEKDSLYYVTFSRNGSANIVAFSKTAVIVEDELLYVVSETNATNQVFKAPDPEEYPYIYVQTNNNASVVFKFYRNRNASEYDGAAYNVKRVGTTAERPVGRDIYANFLYYDTDINKLLYAKSISGNTVTWEYAGSRLDKYDYVRTDSVSRFSDIEDKDSIGNAIFVRNQNKFGYVSNGKRGDAILTCTANNSTTLVAEQNIFEKDKLYYVTFSRNGYYCDVCFSKTQTIVEEESLRVVHENGAYNQVFKAPDPTEYPYVYIKTANASNVTFKFYPNRNASECDGAAFNVTRVGTTAERPVGYDIYVGFVYYDTDLDKLIYAKAIDGSDVTWGGAGDGLIKKYNYVQASSSYSDLNNVEDIGNVIYVRNQNKLGYISNGIKGDKLFQLSVTTSTPAVQANSLTEGTLYYVVFSRNGYFNKIYFAKNDNPEESDLLQVVSEKNALNQVFKAPDPSVYPYIYVTTADSRGVNVSFYENRNASDYDGAKFNVARNGDTDHRPSGKDIYVGFMYFDSTNGINKPIFAKSINSSGVVSWVDATGVSV